MSWRVPEIMMMRRVLDSAGWTVRQRNGRKLWFKGRPGNELVARNMNDAYNLELTLRRANSGGFMWGLEIAELLGSARPPEKRAFR